MSLRSLVLLLLGCSLASCQFSSLTSSTVTKIQRKIRSVVRGSKLPTALRLSFHVCVGGCNGCLNVEDPHNAGLADLVAHLDEVYLANSYDTVLSRADFWALAGIYAVDKTIENANSACDEEDCAVPASGLVFQWGREDCATSPYTTEEVGLPEATLDYTGVTDFFASEFGFDANETVALMGAHTLGRAKSANSGFNGNWITGGAQDFNNEYYKRLSDSSNTWRHKDITPDDTSRHWQWSSAGVGFMLNTDVALYIDIQTDSDGQSSCTFDTCSLAPTASVVEAFAESNEAWVSAFTSVFTKMLAHGTSSLRDLA